MHSIIQTPIYLVKMSFLSTVFSLKQYILGKKNHVSVILEIYFCQTQHLPLFEIFG